MVMDMGIGRNGSRAVKFRRGRKQSGKVGSMIHDWWMVVMMMMRRRRKRRGSVTDKTSDAIFITMCCVLRCERPPQASQLQPPHTHLGSGYARLAQMEIQTVRSTT